MEWNGVEWSGMEWNIYNVIYWLRCTSKPKYQISAVDTVDAYRSMYSSSVALCSSICYNSEIAITKCSNSNTFHSL